MTWTAYLVSFQVLSPIHIGWRKLGNLQQTRSFVTGRLLWGAFTARLTRESGSVNYGGVGGKVDEQFAFTYFYPSTEKDKVALWPWGNTKSEFEWTFLGSYASTALQDGRSSEAGSLHETEYIAPSSRDRDSDPSHPVYLIGYVFIRDDNVYANWRSALNKIQFGGERGTGWGRVRCVACDVVANNTCFDFALSYVDRPVLEVPKDKLLLAHTLVPKRHSDSVEGTMEPFLGRETRSDSGFGKSFSNPEICWAPGSKVVKSVERFQILSKGIWGRIGTYST